MKKRLKGLLSLWLVLVMVVSSPITAFAATTANVYFYTGTTTLKNNDQPSSEVLEKLTGEEAFQVDKALDAQYSNKIPVGYKLTGWKLWSATSGFFVSNAYELKTNGSISKTEFSNKFTDDNVVLEPLLELNYKITHQPTNAEPYVVINEEDAVSTYKWYPVQEYSVGDEESIVDKVGSYDSASDMWRGVGSDDTAYSLSLSVGGLTVGDTLQITPIGNTDIEIEVAYADISLSQDMAGVWSGTIASTDFFGLNITSASAFSVKIKGIHKDSTPVDGQNTSVFSGSNGTYFCKVTFTNKASLDSEVFTYTRYGTTSTPSSNGSCKLQVGGVDVVEAAPGDTVTIVATPNTGYEIDTVTVTNTDGRNIEVTNNTFTMPDYPVTVNVTFKKKTYVVTLPQKPIGYSVTGSSTSPVEHGSDYTFTVTLNEGYAASKNFAVSANDTVLTASVNGKEYTYTISSVTEEQNITVTGVEKEYAIAKSETTNGSYKVTTDGIEVTAPIKDTKVTITPIPSEGYELDEITVTKTGDSNTTVLVDDSNQFIMPDYSVTINVTFKKKTYVVTLPQGQKEYSVTSSQKSPVEHGSKYTFIVTLEKGYVASADFEVRANGNVLATSDNESPYTYTIEEVTTAQEITVSGVADGTAPTITITLDENNKWQDFLNQIPFGLFFKEGKSLTIVATDEESEIQSVKYYLTDTDLFPEDKTYTAEDIEKGINGWNIYNESISLSEDKKYVLYVKVTDAGGNVSYASTAGIVIDTTAPVISGIANGETYYGDTSFAVSDEYLKSVTIDDKPVQPDGDSYKITADNKSHTVTAEDQAGNAVTYEISVYKKYDIKLPEVSVGYTIKGEQDSLVEHGKNYTFTVTINNGYVASGNFTVSANNMPLTPEIRENVYYYTITNVTKEQNITVTGVVEKYNITKSGAEGGSYTVKADGSEVTAATKDTKVTITPTPAEGYKLAGIAVTKTGDSNTEVMVTDGSFTMPDYPVTVSVTFEKLTYAVALPTNPVGYTVTSEQSSSVEHGDAYTFVVTVKDGYVASENYTVKSNSIALTATKVNGAVYTYTIEKVTEAQEITVTGVKDGTVPVVKIILDEKNWWQSFLHKISFGLFFKEEKSLTIDATDAESGINSVKYYLADTDLFPEDKTYTAEEIESRITTWTDYKESISLTGNKSHVLYAKAVDKEGNVSYASTTGIVIDTMVPVISGIKGGETYYGDISFTVRDDHLDTVKVDGMQVQADSDSYKIPADNASHTVVAEDLAGNSVSYAISVYKKYDITLPEETVSYKVESTQTSPVNYGSDYIFTVTLNEEYTTSNQFAVNANNAALDATSVNGNVYTYTIKNVTEAQEITVTGVVIKKYAITKPTVEGGSYTVTATDGREVTAVSKDETVTIQTTAAVGYELDAVTVTKTGDSSKSVAVTNNSFTMPNYPVTINVSFKKLTYAVTLPEETARYKVEGLQTSPVEHGNDYAFTVTLKAGYGASDSFTVKTNGTGIKVKSVNGNVYEYTIQNVTTAQRIEISGVVDVKAPEITISLDEKNQWQSFLHKITFGLFFKEEKNLTIDTTDEESGIESVKYYLADTDLFPEDKAYTAEEIESRITTWADYRESISLTGNKSHVLYAKAVDKEGNVSYASTTGIVIDTMAPVISGIKGGETYYGDISFTVRDDHLKTVTVDDSQVQLENDTYKITADNASHTVVAEDKAGNSVSCKISVYKKYGITLPEETVSYKVESTQTSPVNYGSDYIFTVTLNEEYTTSNQFAVNANNTALDATSVKGNVYTYTIKNVTEAQEITVTGVVIKKYAITKPTVTGGSYTVTADGSEVTAAAKNTVITITPTPSEGYELGAVKVTKTEDSNTTVSVDANNQFTMPNYPVTIQVTFKKLTYAVTLPQETESYAAASTQTAPVEHGGRYTFTVTLKDGYSAADGFAVRANGIGLTGKKVNENQYTYTIEGVKEAQNITVSGVRDITPAAITITLDENNWWESFLNKISFNLFFKEQKSLVVKTNDQGSGVKSTLYYLANEDLFPVNQTYTAQEIESTITSWTEYKESLSISEDQSYVLYVKAVDQAGNVSYASTTGIVIDTMAPVIGGIADGGIYYGDTSFTVIDDHLKTVTVDGSQVQPENGTYKITADNQAHIVKAEDEAGNLVIDTITVYQTYAVTLPQKTESYAVASTQTAPVKHGGSYTFTVTINDGYAASENFAVQANDTELTATDVSGKVYTYTIQNVTKAQKITVSGVVVAKYDITKSAATGGSYTVTADSSEVTEAAKDTVVTITPTPAEGYELDEVKITKTEDSNTTVSVDANNQFTMPDYPVTIQVTFKKLTYAVTLPQETDSYAAASTQTTPVEHGGSYTFTVTLKEGYAASGNFAVQANGTALTATSVSGNQYTYIINAVKSNQTIEVLGVVPVITKNTEAATTGGSFTVQADGEEVGSAAGGKQITVIPQPEDGYELDTIIVTKTDDKTVKVPVENNQFTMPDYPVTIDVTFKKKTYTVTLPENQVGYEAASTQTAPVAHGESYTFTVTLQEGYSAADGFAVMANGIGLTGKKVNENQYTYTIEGVKEAQNITVSGVRDITPAAITITLDDNNWWESFLNKISFNLFFKEQKSLVVKTSDKGSGVKSTLYYLANKDLFPVDQTYTAQEIESTITSWKEYKESLSISENQNYVLYVKAVDQAGNVSYASTTGIVIDTMAPVIGEIADGGIYYGDTSFTVTDDHLKTVTVDGSQVKLENGTYKITADNQSHTVKAEDEAGNLVSNTITVYQTYAVSLPKETDSYTVKSEQTSPVNYGTDYTFTVTLKDGYTASGNFAVKANDTELTATDVSGKEYTYTIKNVTEEQSITVTGVVEKYGITKTAATGGSYTVTADGSEVTAAIKDTKVTIAPTPEEGYELDAVKVTKTEDSNTTISIDGSNQFTMPDYPVTIQVTFKKLTYAVTLPQETDSYAVASTQTTPVEHGGSYTFTVTLKEGYAASGNFAVQANGTALTATGVSGKQYTYIINAVKSNQTIEVLGVVPVITKNTEAATTGGSFTVQADGEEVGSAADGKQITVIPQPEDGYELDTIAVTKTDDKTVKVPVENNQFTMPDYPVTIDVTFKKLTYTVTLPENQVGYEAASTQTAPVEHGASYTFTVTLQEGYSAADGFAVRANGIGLTGKKVNENQYTYTIEGVKEAQNITVSGVKDITPAAITITLDENNRWESFLNKISFNLFFKEQKSLVVKTSDQGSGVKATLYYLANKDLFPVDQTYTAQEIESTITSWTEYKESLSISEDQSYVLYVKAVDQAGNVSYASTTGIVIDTMAPVIGEIADGGIYYGDTSFTVIDDHLKTVTVDGSQMQLENGTYKITADNQSHTVKAEDEAGNLISNTITVYQTYAISLPKETDSYTVKSEQTSPVNYGGSYTFTVTINDGYAASENFAVQANDTELTASDVSGKVYTYTIQNVTKAQEITVSGVVVAKYDITKSAATGGSYTVTADSSEVTEAAKDTVVTITPTPAEGYELDAVKVTKTEDSNTTISIDGSNQFTMPDYPVTVNVTFKKKTYAVTLPKETDSYAAASTQTTPVEHGGSYTFTVTLKEGYAASENFAVQANGTALTATDVNVNIYTYTIKNITEAQEITVTGVKDGTAPVIKITLDEKNWWQSFLNKISFGLFFKKEKNFTIDATDEVSEIQSVEYYLADTDLFPKDKTYTAEEIENKITGWTKYKESISLSEDKNYVLYVKAVDQAGNVSYASTTGIVIDTTAPVITGIENGGKYYGDIFFTISDDNLDTVTLDKKALEVTGCEREIRITADNQKHTIQVTDKAGNQISYQISVYQTWVRDGIMSGGVYNLQAGVPYKLGSGKWKVAGDNTIYEGGMTFYVWESGTYEFQKQ